MRQKICLLPGSPGMYIAFFPCHSGNVTILTWEEAVIWDITILTDSSADFGFIPKKSESSRLKERVKIVMSRVLFKMV